MRGKGVILYPSPGSDVTKNPNSRRVKDLVKGSGFNDQLTFLWFSE